MNYIYLAIILLLCGLYLYERFFGGESRRTKEVKSLIKEANEEIKKSDIAISDLSKERKKLNEELNSTLGNLTLASSMRTRARRAKK